MESRTRIMETMEPDYDDNNDFHELQLNNNSFVAELGGLRLSNQNLKLKLTKRAEEFVQVQQHKEDSHRERFV